MMSGRPTKILPRKERPRSTDRGSKVIRKSRDGGISDKNGSPIVYGIEESENESPAVILQVPVDMDVQEFIINKDELKVRRQPHPPITKRASKKVYVHKQSGGDNFMESAKSKRTLVARKTVEGGKGEAANVLEVSTGPQEVETIKPHSILGSVYDFQDEMRKKGIEVNVDSHYQSKLHSLSLEQPLEERLLSPQEELKRDSKMNEVKALENWEKKMKERKRQLEYLQNTTNKSAEELLMNVSDTFQKVQLEREIIHRAIPSLEYGKGYRVGSEFWAQEERIGDERAGIHLTLTKSEKGEVPPIEHVWRPSTVMKETNGLIEQLKNVWAHYPWWRSSYLKERKSQLKNIVEGLIVHEPYMDELEIIGHSVTGNAPQNRMWPEDRSTEQKDNEEIANETEGSLDNDDPFNGYDDVIPLPVFGPSLVMNGQSLQWIDSDMVNDDFKTPIVRLLFQAPINGNGFNVLDITNDGTAAIYYSWQLERPVDPFGLKVGRPIQRFYFDVRSGVILPGDSIQMNFSFKSPNAGVFSEVWILETNPVLCGGAPVKVALQGIATLEDLFKADRLQLEKELAARETLHEVENILKEILSGVRTPPRPSTPEDAYLTERNIFERTNEKLEFDSEIISQLSALYSTITEGETWNLSVDTLREAIKSVEDEEQMEAHLETLNSYLAQMAKKRVPQSENLILFQSYQLLCDAIDNFSDEARNLQRSLGVPEKELVVQSSFEEVIKKGKRAEEKSADKKQESKKERREMASPNKGKSANNAKTRSKDTLISKAESAESEVKVSHGSVILDEGLSQKYNEKLYILLYEFLAEAVQKMEELTLPPAEVRSPAE